MRECEGKILRSHTHFLMERRLVGPHINLVILTWSWCTAELAQSHAMTWAISRLQSKPDEKYSWTSVFQAKENLDTVSPNSIDGCCLRWDRTTGILIENRWIVRAVVFVTIHDSAFEKRFQSRRVGRDVGCVDAWRLLLRLDKAAACSSKAWRLTLNYGLWHPVQSFGCLWTASAFGAFWLENYGLLDLRDAAMILLYSKTTFGITLVFLGQTKSWSQAHPLH
jgi:hypothetical protein